MGRRVAPAVHVHDGAADASADGPRQRRPVRLSPPVLPQRRADRNGPRQVGRRRTGQRGASRAGVDTARAHQDGRLRPLLLQTPVAGFLDHFDEIDANKNDALNADELLGVPWGADAFLGDCTTLDMARLATSTLTRRQLPGRAPARCRVTKLSMAPHGRLLRALSPASAVGARAPAALRRRHASAARLYDDSPTRRHRPAPRSSICACSSIPLNASEAVAPGLADASVAYFKGRGSKAATEAAGRKR